MMELQELDPPCRDEQNGINFIYYCYLSPIKTGTKQERTKLRLITYTVIIIILPLV